MTEQERKTLIPPTEQEKKEREACPACQQKRQHTPEEWKNHPRAGKGKDKGV